MAPRRGLSSAFLDFTALFPYLFFSRDCIARFFFRAVLSQLLLSWRRPECAFVCSIFQLRVDSRIQRYISVHKVFEEKDEEQAERAER